jgi:cyclohexa-1,5-dienecarbonyl-CoA hydratase
MAEGTIRCETRENVGYITLDSPPLNILTGAMMDELADALEGFAADDTLKAIAVTANGKAFSGGADVEEHHPDHVEVMIASFTRLFRVMGGLELPVVMAVEGAALGGGFELAMMADILLATPEATFGQPEIRLGFFPPLAIVRLLELVPQSKAIEITASGTIYPAEEMREMGIVSRVVAGDEMEEVLESVLKDFRKASPLVMRLNVGTLKRLRGMPFDEALQEAGRTFLEDLMVTEEPLEGIASFREKRRPEWKNR